MNDETYLFFRLHSPEAYAQTQALLDESRGFPDAYTQQAIPNWDDLEVGSNEKKYLFIDKWRLKPGDEDLISSMVGAGYADLILMAEYEADIAEVLDPVDPELVTDMIDDEYEQDLFDIVNP
jgi:hypothetical protein